MVAKPGSLAPHSLIKWMWSGVKLFGGLLDFPYRPGVTYLLAWLGMNIFILNTKDVLTILFIQCYLAPILRSASLPQKHSTIQLVYWAETRISFRQVPGWSPHSRFFFLLSSHSAPEMNRGWSKSVSWFLRGMDQVSSRTGLVWVWLIMTG